MIRTMARPSPPTAGPRAGGRPRSPEADEAIASATVELLAEVGYDGLSMERVASRAGVGKATVYRRFPSKVELVVAAIDTVAAGVPIPDTGALRSDLVDMLGEVVDAFTKSAIGPIIAGMTHEVSRNPALAETFRRTFVANRRSGAMELLRRGVERGELRPDVDRELLLDVLIGWIYYRQLVTGGSLSRRQIEQVVDTALAGVAP